MADNRVSPQKFCFISFLIHKGVSNGGIYLAE